MSGPEFFQTGMGHKFFEGTMPSLVRELRQLNENLTKIQEISIYGSPKGTEVETCGRCGVVIPDYGLCNGLDQNHINVRLASEPQRAEEPRRAMPAGWHTNLLEELAKEAWNSSEPGAHVVGEHLLDTRVDHTNGHKTDEMKHVRSVVAELEGIERWAASIRKKLSEEL